MATRTKRLEPPSLEYLLALRTELEHQYADQDTQIKRMREVRELKRSVALSSELRLVDVEVRDPTATDEIQRVAATLSVNPATVEVTPANPGDKAQRNATLREHWTEGVLLASGTRTPGQNTFTQSVDACVGDGGAWTKFLFTRDVWDSRYSIRPKQFEDVYEGESADDEDTTEDATTAQDETTTTETSAASEPKTRRVKASREAQYNAATEEAKKASGPPFTWVCCDSLSVYPVWQSGRLAEVLEVEERPRSQTFRQYRLRNDNAGNIVPDELGQGQGVGAGIDSGVVVLHHWDDQHATVLVVGNNKSGQVSGQVVQQWKHRYKRPPFFYAPGLLMSHWRNRKVGWGVAEAKRWLVEYRSYLWTIHAQVAARDALPPMAEETLPDATGAIIGRTGTEPAPTKPVMWNLREIVKLAPGKRMQPIQFPAVSQALKEEITLVSQAIEALTSPRVTGQIGSALEGAGFAISQVLAEAKIRHNPIVQSIEQMLVEVILFCWQLVREVVGETVWVGSESGEAGWIGAGPEDLKANVRVQAHLDPERPSAKLIEARYWHERVREGTASKDAAIEAMGDNPDEVRLGIGLDRMRQSDWYIKLQDQYVLDEAGMGDLLTQAQQIAATGVLPGMGPPGTLPPGGTPPAMGNSIVPDMGNLAMSPGGAGAAPMPGGGGPVVAAGPTGPVVRNLPVPGVGPGAVVPTQSAAPGIQRLGG